MPASAFLRFVIASDQHVADVSVDRWRVTALSVVWLVGCSFVILHSPSQSTMPYPSPCQRKQGFGTTRSIIERQGSSWRVGHCNCFDIAKPLTAVRADCQPRSRTL